LILQKPEKEREASPKKNPEYEIPNPKQITNHKKANHKQIPNYQKNKIQKRILDTD
jgi:hypothetical protein